MLISLLVDSKAVFDDGTGCLGTVVRGQLYADLAHLVERHLAKVEVAGSSPVIRSKGRLINSLSVLKFYMAP